MKLLVGYSVGAMALGAVGQLAQSDAAQALLDQQLNSSLQDGLKVVSAITTGTAGVGGITGAMLFAMCVPVFYRITQGVLGWWEREHNLNIDIRRKKAGL